MFSVGNLNSQDLNDFSEGYSEYRMRWVDRERESWLVSICQITSSNSCCGQSWTSLKLGAKELLCLLVGTDHNASNHSPLLSQSFAGSCIRNVATGIRTCACIRFRMQSINMLCYCIGPKKNVLVHFTVHEEVEQNRSFQNVPCLVTELFLEHLNLLYKYICVHQVVK